MNTAPQQLNDLLQKGSEAQSALARPDKPMPDSTGATPTDPATQVRPIKRRLSFWEAAYLWAMARH